MKYVKRSLAILLSLIICVSMVPMSVFANETKNETSLDNDQVKIEGNNGFGNLLSAEINANQQEIETEAADYAAGYSVSDLVIEGNTATVTYDSLEEATLIVAIYDEEGLKLLNSGKIAVTADAKEATVTIEGEMPEYFMASAYLVDAYDLSPLCPEYDTPMYTREMQELLASTTADYEEELVYNFDDSTETNFAVFAESTKVIEYKDGVNTVASVDDENGIYVIENADSSFTSLVEGDIFAYTYGETDILIAKVASIAIDGTTVTIAGSEMEMEDVFAAIKIEGESNADGTTIDMSEVPEGIELVTDETELADVSTDTLDGTFVHKSEQLYEEQGSGSNTVIDETYNLEGKFGGDEFNLSLKGSLGLKAEVELEYFLTKAHQYIDFRVNSKTSLSASLSVAVQAVDIPLGDYNIPVFPGVSVGISPSLVLKASVSATVKAEFETTIGFVADVRNGEFDVDPVVVTPVCETSMDIKGKIFLGFKIKPAAKLLGGFALEAGFSAQVGIEVSAKEESGGDDHGCWQCYDGDISFIVEISPEISFFKIFKFERKILDWDVKFANFYFCECHDDFGFGPCPHKKFEVTVTVEDEEGNFLENAKVTIRNQDISVDAYTNKNGVAVLKVVEGEYAVNAYNGDLVASRYLKLEEPQKVWLVIDPDSLDNQLAPNPTSGGILGTVTSEKDSYSNGKSGQCGDNVYWYLVDGTLTITGTGDMYDYEDYDAYENYQSILGNCESHVDKVVIENGVTSIGDYAFDHWRTLTSITIPDSVISIGEQAFSYCESLTSITIPNSVTSIGDNAFRNCSSLTDIEIPASVISIGDFAFRNCSSLISIDIAEGVTSIGYYAFSNCSSLTSIEIPASVISIWEYAFCNCTSLTSIEIPDSVTSIENGTFCNCTSLTSIEIPASVTSIGDYAFDGCSSLTSIDIPEGVTSIGFYAFRYCSSLTSIEIPDSVTSIGYGAFHGCTSLTSIEIPASEISIGDCAFFGCTSLTNIEIPASVISIGDCAFLGCSSLISIDIAEGVTSIGDYAFSDCYSLTSIMIPDSVTSIGDDAFSDCDSLVSVIFQGNPPEIYSDSFAYVTANAYYPADNPLWTSDVMLDYGGNLTWIPYTIDANGDMVTGEATVVAAAADEVATTRDEPAEQVTEDNVVEEDAPTLDAIFGGEYGTEETETYTLKTATFSSLVPGGQYVIYALADLEAEDPIAHSNLLYIDQGEAAEDGTLVFKYIQREDTIISYVVACGASNKNLADAEITFPEIQVVEGELQAIDPVVVYDGKTLTEGLDYIVTGVTSFDATGTYVCYIRGVHNYTGLIECKYSICAHNYVAVVTEPTCTEQGYTTHTCSICGDSYVDGYIDAGHDYQDGTCITCGAQEPVQPFDAVITAGGSVETAEIYSGEYYTLKFVPTETDLYTFTSSENNDPKATLYDANMEEIDSDDDGGNYYDFKLSVVLKKNNSYYLTVGTYDDGAKYTVYVEQTHSYNSSTVTEPTCTTVGKVEFKCVYCGDCYYEETDALEHDYYFDKQVAPTCEEGGYTVYTCDGCDDSYTDDYTDALGHAYDDGVVTTVPTCEKTGVKTFTCQNDKSHTYTEVIPATGHTEVKDAAVAPTCENTGLTEGKHCSVCNKVITKQEVIPVLGHDHVKGVCTRCGDTITYVEPTTVKSVNVAASGKIKLTWTAVDNAAKYEVYRSTSKTGEYTKLNTISNVSCTDPSAEAGTYYYYYVVAVHADGTKSEASNVVGRTCDLARPTTVTLSNVASSGKIKVSWTEVEGATKYQVYRSTTKNGTYTLQKTTAALTWTDGNSTAGKTYYYKVKAVHSKSAANSALTSYKSKMADLARPATVTMSNVASTGKVKISWTKVEGAAKYQVYRATSKTGTYSLKKTTTSLSWTDTNTTAGKTYYYKVKAVHSNTNANSALTSYKSRTCDLKRPTVSITRSSGKPKVSWTAVSGATKYKIYRSTSKTGTYSLVKTTTSKYWKDTTAKKGKTYYYKVVAVHSNSAANSAYSTVKSIKCTK